jgi:N-acetylglucosamine kinase-like BadF-type ATPase
MEQYTIGIDIGGTKTTYGLLDHRNKIIRRKTHQSNAECSPEVFFDEVVSNIRGILSDGKQNTLNTVSVCPHRGLIDIYCMKSINTAILFFISFTNYTGRLFPEECR